MILTEGGYIVIYLHCTHIPHTQLCLIRTRIEKQMKKNLCLSQDLESLSFMSFSKSFIVLSLAS